MTRRPLPPLPDDLHAHRLLPKADVAALLGVSEKLVDQMVYGSPKRGIAPWGPPSLRIGDRRLWRLRDVLRWIDAQEKATGGGIR